MGSLSGSSELIKGNTSLVISFSNKVDHRFAYFCNFCMFPMYFPLVLIFLITLMLFLVRRFLVLNLPPVFNIFLSRATIVLLWFNGPWLALGLVLITSI